MIIYGVLYILVYATICICIYHIICIHTLVSGIIIYSIYIGIYTYMYISLRCYHFLCGNGVAVLYNIRTPQKK